MTARLLVAAALLVSFAVVACGDDGEPSRDLTPSPTPTPSIFVATIGEIRAAGRQLADAILAGDAGTIRGLAGESLAANLDEAALDTLATCVPDDIAVDLLVGEISITGDAAAITATWQVTFAGQQNTADRTWSYELQSDETWAVAALPDCPIPELDDLPSPGAG